MPSVGVRWSRPAALLAGLCVAGAAAIGADRVQAGRWDTSIDVDGGTLSRSICVSQADAEALNGDAASVRAYLERVTARSGCKVDDVRVDGNRVTVTSTCAAGRRNVGTTDYHGDHSETRNSAAPAARSRRVSACG